jgi:hypothetical protein
MKGMAMYSVLVFVVTASSQSGVRSPDRSLIVPFSREQNPKHGTNTYEPEYVSRLYVRVKLLNPATGRSLVWDRGLIDTAADHCHVSGRVAAMLGLRHSHDSPTTIATPAGDVRMYAMEAEYELLDGKGKRVADFPRTKTDFYVNPQSDLAYDVVLGQIGFLDRFDTVTLRYDAGEIHLVW